MNAIFTVYGDNSGKYLIFNRASADFRLDEQLDSGNVVTILEEQIPFPPMSMGELVFQDNNALERLPCYFFDSVEEREEKYFIHNLLLIEPTRRLMGILIDGMKVTQPIDGNTKKTLYNIVERLLKVCSMLGENDTPEFSLTSDDKILSLLQNTESPEFAWEAETQLWECLKDIGDVINCIPRLTFNSNKTAFNVVTFDAVNKVTGEREL
jgi:hypothetical protein